MTWSKSCTSASYSCMQIEWLKLYRCYMKWNIKLWARTLHERITTILPLGHDFWLNFSLGVIKFRELYLIFTYKIIFCWSNQWKMPNFSSLRRFLIKANDINSAKIFGKLNSAEIFGKLFIVSVKFLAIIYKIMDYLENFGWLNDRFFLQRRT